MDAEDLQGILDQSGVPVMAEAFRAYSTDIPVMLKHSVNMYLQTATN
jgi:hypothetical protein